MGAPVKGDRPRIEILMLGRTLPPIQEYYGDYDRWFRERPSLPAEYRIHQVRDGQPIPPPEESHGWILSGASESVNDHLPWLLAAGAAVRRAVERGHPVLGICFGHQLLAATLGGRVELNPKGWELGSASVSLTPEGNASPLFAGLGNPVPVYQTHCEIVTAPPSGAVILAYNEMGLQAFQVGDGAFGVQFHPEFTRGIMDMYVQLRAGENRLSRPDVSTWGDRSSRVLTNFVNLIYR